MEAARVVDGGDTNRKLDLDMEKITTCRANDFNNGKDRTKPDQTLLA